MGIREKASDERLLMKKKLGQVSTDRLARHTWGEGCERGGGWEMLVNEGEGEVSPGYHSQTVKQDVRAVRVTGGENLWTEKR